MEWFAWPITALRSFFRPQEGEDIIPLDRSSILDRPVLRGRLKTPFYSHIPTWRIRSYQKYVDRAFELSPTLEFSEGDQRFNDLLVEAADKQEISQLDLELMRMQYVLADPYQREQHRNNWAVKVINQNQEDFFPSPWAILEAVFLENR